MRPSVTCYAAPHSRKSVKWCRAFARGCGGAVIFSAAPRPGPAALYGKPALWPLLARFRRDGRAWYYGDNGYFGRRGWYRVTRNALQHDGRGPGDPDRLRRLGVEVRPWQRGGRHVVVCPPGAVFARLNGFDAADWLRRVVDRLKRVTDREIRIRRKEARLERPLAADLQDAHALVAYTSAAAVEAVCAGVPVFVTAPCAAAAVGLSDPSRIEAPAYPDGREAWAACLAANQWTLREIAEGHCWRSIAPT